jgi:hypothetical protein
VIPRSSADYYRRQQRILAALLLGVRRLWRRIDSSSSFQQQYDDGLGAQMLALVVAAQVAAARDADGYTADVLNELAFGPATTAGVVAAEGFAGATGDGRQVATLLAQAVPRAGRVYNALLDGQPPARVPGLSTGVVDEDLLEALREEEARTAREIERAAARFREESARQALADAGRWIELAAASTVIDTARAAESAAMVQRPWVDGYVRMLNPPSCSRCITLAGKFYRWNEGFSRHEPTCDCRHIPASEEGERYGSLLTNPNLYFDSLDRAEQDRIFTKTGAEAIRDGADVSQVVNARRGMKTAQVFGRDVVITNEGTTRRGFAYSRLPGNRDDDKRAKGERYFRTQTVRLMPETLYEIATDRADAVRLLRLHGFLA